MIKGKLVLNMQNIRCPLCSSSQIELLYSVSSKDTARHLNAEDNDKVISVIEEIWTGRTGGFYSCNECSFSFAWPFRAGNKDFYSAVYTGGVYYPEEKWDYTITGKSITETIETDKRREIHLLEIGAGNGAFIKSISPGLIPKENILCTEFSDYGKNEILRYGVECISADVKDIATANRERIFDIVCLFQVLEHMDAYEEFFENINKLTADGAHLYLTVPNDKYRIFYDALGSKFDIPPVHVSRWNKQTLEKLFSQNDWQLVEHKVENPGFLKKLRKFLFNRYNHLDFAEKVDKINFKALQLSIKSILFLFFILYYFLSVIKLGTTELGTAQWAHFQKLEI